MTRVAIIGAGMAGLVLATELRRRASVTLFEKSQGVGGRMATRRAGEYQFDHGAQFFTAKTDEFAEFVGGLAEKGIVDAWKARFVEIDGGAVALKRQWGDAPAHWVGTPGMTAPAAHLARDVDVRLRARVTRLDRVDHRWRLFSEAGADLGVFDWVISTAPAAQAASLLPREASFAQALDGSGMRGCFALLLGFRDAPALDWDAALVRRADISWVSLDSSKPARAGGCSLVAHSTNAWADAHIDDDIGGVAEHLSNELARLAGIDANDAEYRTAHRWRYANADKRDGEPCYVDADLGLAACGDWCIRGRVEAAFSSAKALARRLEDLLA